MIHVYLDDLRSCPIGFVLARNADECMLLLEQSEIDILSLDHDLGWNQPSGYDLVKRMVEQGLYPKEVYIHTANPIGRNNMYQLLYRYKPAEVKLHNFAMPDELLRTIQERYEKIMK